MTRKRFIKLLMAEGVSRNRAQEIAWVVNRSGRPYHVAFPATRALLRTEVVCARIGVAFRAAGASIVRLAGAVTECAAAVQRTDAIKPIARKGHLEGMRTSVAYVDEWDGWQHAAIKDKAMAGRPPRRLET